MISVKDRHVKLVKTRVFCYNKLIIRFHSLQVETKIHYSWRIALALLLVPFSAAAAPAAVQGIAVSSVDGNAQVTWQAVADAAYYRIYYSSQSILDNSGIYDDFVETDGPVTEYVLDGFLLSNKVFVAVLAVDANGAESSVFLEEGSAVLTKNSLITEGVELQSTQPTQSSSAASQETTTLTVTAPTEQRFGTASSASSAGNTVPAWEAPVSDGKLHLLLTEATSPTEVLLQFNEYPTVEPDSAPNAFSIVDGDGNPLPIRGIYIQQEFITVQTATQVANELYQLRLSEPLMSTAGSALDEVDRKAVFRGHADGTTPTVPVSTVVSSVASSAKPITPTAECSPENIATVSTISGLRLRSTKQANGNYNLTAQWNYDTKNCAELLRYVVRQSRDRGRTFSDPQIIPAAIAGIEIPNATPGEYGLGIAVMNPQGYVSQEVFETITLPGAVTTVPLAQITKLAAPAAQTPMRTTPTQTSRLPSSGAGLLIVGIVSIGFAHQWRRRLRGKIALS